jgi:hypothetical protein
MRTSEDPRLQLRMMCLSGKNGSRPHYEDLQSRRLAQPGTLIKGWGKGRASPALIQSLEIYAILSLGELTVTQSSCQDGREFGVAQGLTAQ